VLSVVSGRAIAGAQDATLIKHPQKTGCSRITGKDALDLHEKELAFPVTISGNERGARLLERLVSKIYLDPDQYRARQLS
jgi:hypothetical protein